jgi:hypothetical protein
MNWFRKLRTHPTIRNAIELFVALAFFMLWLWLALRVFQFVSG